RRRAHRPRARGGSDRRDHGPLRRAVLRVRPPDAWRRRMTALGLDGVTVELGGRVVVDDVSASVDRGEWVALIGPNGAGKTHLLRAIARLPRHDRRESPQGTQAVDLA